MSNARFSILQSRAVKDIRISDSQFRTLAALGMYADQDGWCFPSLTTLGKDLGKSKQAVGRDTIALRKLGYLEVTARYDKATGSRRSSLYRLRFDLPPVNMGDSIPSTSEVDTPSTPEVDVNDPINAPKKRTTTTSEPPIFEIDQLALNAQALYTAITNQITFPPSWEEKYTRALSDVLTGYFSGEIQTAATSAKPVFTRYCNTIGKGGTKYRPTGTGWLDWWVAELAPKPEEAAEPAPSMPQPSEELKARARELFADEIAKIGVTA